MDYNEPIRLQPLQNQLYPSLSTQNGQGPLTLLEPLDHIVIVQRREMLEIVCGCETKNRYDIFSDGTKLFTSQEEVNCCTRNFCGNIRPFSMTILTMDGEKLVHLIRPLACQSCCFPCCLQSMTVHSPPGTSVGRVEQMWSLFSDLFQLQDESGKILLWIKRPCCPPACSCCCQDVEFKVYKGGEGEMEEGMEVGLIVKKWMGCYKEGFTDADNFVIRFNRDLDVRAKGLLLGACFLIDYMFFENNGGVASDG